MYPFPLTFVWSSIHVGITVDYISGFYHIFYILKTSRTNVLAADRIFQQILESNDWNVLVLSIVFHHFVNCPGAIKNVVVLISDG